MKVNMILIDVVNERASKLQTAKERLLQDIDRMRYDDPGKATQIRNDLEIVQDALSYLIDIRFFLERKISSNEEIA